MIKSKHCILLFLFVSSLLFNFSVYGQVAAVDSLERVLKSATGDAKQTQIYNELAEAYVNADQVEKSLSMAKKALDLATEENLPVEKAKACNTLSYIQRYRLDNTEKAIQWAEKARQIEGDGKALKKERLKAYDALSIIYYQRQNLIKVLEYTTESLELANELDDKDKIASAYNLLGLYYYHKGELKKTAIFWEKELEVMKQIGAKKTSLATTYNNLGVIYKKRGDYQKAIQFYQENLRLNEALGDTMNVAMTLSNIGNVYYTFGVDFDKALEYYQEGLRMFKSAQDTALISKSYINLGLVQQEKENYEEARDFFEKSIAMSRKINNRKNLATAENALGVIYLEQGNYRRALNYSQEALSFFTEMGDKGGIAETQKNIGEAYFKLGQHQKALQYYRKSLQLNQEMGLNKELSDVYKSISEVYADLNNFEMALDFYTKYSNQKDSTLSEEYLKTIEDLRAKYESDKKDMRLVQMAEKDQLNSKIIRQQRWLLLAGALVLLVIIGFSILVFRQNNKIKRVNNLLESQNEEIRLQRDQIVQQKEEITDSIHYASRIQRAILPPEESVDKILADHFILFKPRDIVSGDFYWVKRVGNKTIFTAADCTGHGVPGAFMSMLGTAFLNEIVNKQQDLSASVILNELRRNVVSSLHQTGKEGESKDGMDMSLVIIDHDKQTCQFAGAYNPLVLIRNKEIHEFKADKMPIGIYHHKNDDFTHQDIELEKGDALYLFSDGYVDQFGGERQKKFMKKNFKELLAQISEKPMKDQREILDETFENWRGNIDQIDDIIVMGVRVI